MTQTPSAQTCRSDPKGWIVIATPGLIGPDRGAELVVQALRDSGYEVIRSGPDATVGEIIATVISVGASILGLSILSGTHLTIVARVIELLAQRAASDTAVLVGGAIPPEDAFALEILGARRVFTPDTSLGEVLESVDDLNDIYGSVVRPQR